MDKPLHVAIVGCGWAAGWHVDDLRLLPGLFTMVACCDQDGQKLQAFGERHGIARRARDLEAILALREVDVVVLCTPPTLHHPMAIQALAAGKHVVCEKPLTSSLELVDSIAGAAARSAGRIMPVFQYRFGNGLARVRHAIRSGLAGRHYVSSVETARTRGADYYRTEWRGKFATELGGVLVTQAIHIHDLLFWLIGPAESVLCHKTTRVNPIEVEDCAVASLRMADGSLASLTATLGSVREVTRLRLCFENVTFERGSDQDASRPADEPWSILPRSEAIGLAIGKKMAEVAPARSWFARQYELFYEAIRTGGPLPVTLDDARASIELITGLYLSGESGTAIRLPIGPGSPGYAGWIPQAPAVIAPRV